MRKGYEKRKLVSQVLFPGELGRRRCPVLVFSIGKCILFERV